METPFYMNFFFLVNIYYFLFLNTATLFSRVLECQSLPVILIYVSHDKVLLNGGTG